MDSLRKDIEFIDGVPVSLRNIRYTNAAKHISTIMSERALGLIINELDTADIPLYNELEERKLVAFQDTLSDMLTDEIYPTIYAYVSRRHPELIGEFFDEDGSDFFETLEMTVYNTPLSPGDEQTFFQNQPQGERIGSFSFSEETRVRVIELFLREIFHNYSQEGVSDIEFDDFLFQILLHETLHAISSDLVMPIEQEKSERRWMEIREAILGKGPTNWEELVSSVGYVMNFINVGPGSEEYPFREHPALSLLNEAITDTISARIYSEYTKAKYGKARRYKVSYNREAHIFHRALHDFCQEKQLKINETFLRIEAGYFFPGDKQATGIDDIILPMLKHCSDILDTPDKTSKATKLILPPFYKNTGK